jgi:high-affinity nickel-transport protein
MSKAYDWAFLNPLRKIFYNATTTALSVALALVIGTVELLQVFIRLSGLRGGFFDLIARLDFGDLGYIVVGLFLVAWAASIAYWKLGRIEARHQAPGVAHSHVHVHDSGTRHSHPHLH